MILGLLAFAAAVFALVKLNELGGRIDRIEASRDALARKVSTLQQALEEFKIRDALRAAPPEVAPLVLEPAREASRSPDTGARVLAPPQSTLGAAGAKAPIAPSAPTRPTKVPPPKTLPEPEERSVDWESLLGVKGAAWVGGVALIISAIFFARWTIEQGLVTPALRFALMLFAGIGALIAAELGLRRGYERTANPLSGAGIAILYIAFFAGHSRYDLISMPAAFAGMVVVTITACAVAVRYDAFATAVLGLLGGFATPIALSTGEDRPIGLFSYILILNIGLVAVGIKQRWHGLFELGLMATLLIQIGWYSKFMSSGNLLVGLVSFVVFGIVFLAIPIAVKDDDNARVWRTGILGGLMPFLFMLFVAGSSDYVTQWPLLFGLVAMLDIAILAIALLRSRGELLVSAAVATSLTLTLWAMSGLDPVRSVSVMGSSVGAIALTAIFGLARRFALRIRDLGQETLRVIEGAALASWTGLALFGLVLVGHDRGESAAPFLMIVTALLLLMMERAHHANRIGGALAFGSMILAGLVQLWFMSAVTEATLVPYLQVPILLSLTLSFFAARSAEQKIDGEAELAVRFSSWIAILGLFLALFESEISASGWPLFAAMASQILVVTGSVIRSGWTVGLPALLGASSLHLMIWQIAYMKPHQHGMAFAVGALFYSYFLALPMVLPFARWREAWLPWLTSAAAGVIFFLPLYHVYQEAFSELAPGLLPLAMAAVSALALRVVAGRFEIIEGDPLAARLRLRYLALFSAVALWFIAIAIPLQFDRQWITLGFAIEAMALCWLFGRLPHRGLPVFASVLYAIVGARLLINPEVLTYEERGLPFFNWILYTYGIATACCLIGQWLLRRAAPTDGLVRRLADAVALNGLLLGFWLVNLEILDYFSSGPKVALSGHSGYSVKLALSAGWGLYAVILLVVGVAKDLKPLRYLSLVFLMLTVAKVFLYDLSELGGIFRVFSFLGLAIALILVSLFYQRFVFKKSA